MILRCADRPYRAWTDLRRSRQLSRQQRRESRHSGTAALGCQQETLNQKRATNRRRPY